MRSAEMIEKRTVARQRVLKQGTLAFAGGRVDCTVRNISEGGARLDNVNPMVLPPSFLLVIKNDQFERHCHPVWIRDNQMGVVFD